MPSINVSEEDFEYVAGAAIDAQRAGRFSEAAGLDKMARKINAALSNARTRANPLSMCKAMTWQEVPSVLETLNDV